MNELKQYIAQGYRDMNNSPELDDAAAFEAAINAYKNDRDYKEGDLERLLRMMAYDAEHELSIYIAIPDEMLTEEQNAIMDAYEELAGAPNSRAERLDFLKMEGGYVGLYETIEDAAEALADKANAETIERTGEPLPPKRYKSIKLLEADEMVISDEGYVFYNHVIF